MRQVRNLFRVKYFNEVKFFSVKDRGGNLLSPKRTPADGKRNPEDGPGNVYPREILVKRPSQGEGLDQNRGPVRPRTDGISLNTQKPSLNAPSFPV